MTDLVERAEQFATQTHKRIDHVRKYSGLPYTVHLRNVADLVASATDDKDMIAAAWLHDAVEDTPATFQDIEKAFGRGIALLVRELTDVSKPSDGNRATRKEIDRRHLAKASTRAKTVKLADLIDNCEDISKHDARFARVFLKEMGGLLDVLEDGDEKLLLRARRTLEKWEKKLEAAAPKEHLAAVSTPSPWSSSFLQGRRAMRLFVEAFAAGDVVEALPSFDAGSDGHSVKREITEGGIEIAGVRVKGRVAGYVEAENLGMGKIGDFMHPFDRGQIVEAESSLSEIIHVLTRYQYAFVRAFEDVAGIVTRADIQKPVVRMWLFGMITMIEMEITEAVRAHYPDETWRALLSPARLKKTEEIVEERRRRGQSSELFDCLQLSDKGKIIVDTPILLKAVGFRSKSAGRQVIKELESLRNNLAHSQDIVTHDWAQISRMTQRTTQRIEAASAHWEDQA